MTAKLTSRGILVAAIIALPACTPKMDITQPDETARVRHSVDSGRISSYRASEIRTYIDRDGTRVEVAGLHCAVRSDEVSAFVITPARAELPGFVQSGDFAHRGRPAPLLVSCEGGGLRGAETVFAQDKQVSTVTDAGLGGAILSTVVSGAVASSTPWRFPEEISVVVRPDFR